MTQTTVTANDTTRGEKIAHSGKYNGTTYAEEPSWEPPDDEPQAQPDPTTWEPIDLGPYLRGETEKPEPTIGLARSDGQRFIYPGREHAVLGETESGKTWLALACVAAEIINGNRVVYIHFEESDPGSTIERLRLLGVDAETIAAHLMFVAPAKPVRSGWMDTLLQSSPTLVVLDGINEGMSLHGADIMAADGASTFRRQLVMPCLRAGAATLACDHVPKNVEGRGRDAYGSVHKGNAIDGARFIIENTKPFGRGLRGVSNVFVTKDRPGQLRAHGKPTKQPGKTFFGTLVVDADLTAIADFRLSFFAPRQDDDDEAPESDPDTAATTAIYNLIKEHSPVESFNQLLALLKKAGNPVGRGRLRDILEDLKISDDQRVEEFTGTHKKKGLRIPESGGLHPGQDQ